MSRQIDRCRKKKKRGYRLPRNEPGKEPNVAGSKEPPDMTNVMKNCKDCNTTQGPGVIAGPWSKSASVYVKGS